MPEQIEGIHLSKLFHLLLYGSFKIVVESSGGREDVDYQFLVHLPRFLEVIGPTNIDIEILYHVRRGGGRKPANK